ncbi:hypothetical protein FD755_018216 [Muntiacus reevesi]|uniref:CIDE-N domain-containing protein n=1 Tax=Muntiacus reevesi TaxID=9886 RepID=A0A5N3X9E1_MUNRE|nr:hypothetical protein FD755_018216 [Muntiacus reevesi]
MEVASSPAALVTGEIWALKQKKACDILVIDKSLAPVTLVLAKDGITVDDDDYFLCLPANTKFVALAGNEKWIHNSDGEQIGAGLKWKNVARQRREDLPSIILLSKEELQMFIDVPCSELIQKLGQSHVAVQGRQSTLQQGLDQRGSLSALKKEGSIVSKQQESRADLGDKRDAVDTSVRESSSKVMPVSQILVVLKEKSAPE